MKILSIFSIFLISHFFGISAQATCGHRLEIDPLVIYWNGTKVERQENVVIKGRQANGQCRRYYIGFGKGVENLYARAARHQSEGEKIAYNLYRKSGGENLLKDLPEATTNDVIADRFPSNRPGQIVSENFWFNISGVNSLPRAGTYYDNVRVSFYAHQLNSSRLESFIDFPIQIIVGQSIALSLLDIGGTFDPNDTSHTMNFGKLTSGESGRMDIRVRANLGHRLYMSSQNNGKLQHISSTASVDYSLKVSGRTISLNSSSSGPVLAGESQLPSSESGDLYQVEVNIGDVSSRPAGDYRDVITVSIEAI